LSDSCLILGDFNLPLIDWINTYFPGDSKSQYFYLFFTDFGFTQFIVDCTRNANILDLLLCNNAYLVSDFCVADPFSTSDHESIEVLVISARSKNDNTISTSTKLMWNFTDW